MVAAVMVAIRRPIERWESALAAESRGGCAGPSVAIPYRPAREIFDCVLAWGSPVYCPPGWEGGGIVQSKGDGGPFRGSSSARGFIEMPKARAVNEVVAE